MAIDTTYLDSDADSIMLARPALLAIAKKANESVSVRDFGASPSATPSENYSACQAALNSGAKRVIVPADGDYTINAELTLPAGVTLEGQTGARIIQDTYGLSGVQLRNNNSAVKNLKIENLKTKTALSTSVPNRYDGEVQRSRASGIYVAASSSTIENVACPGFINGINLVGGERIWTTTSGALTTTTLQLNATSQQANDYYNGWTLRIFSTVTATDYVTVSDYDSATNTVTFSTVSTFTGPYYYLLIGDKHTGNTVRWYKGERNDFGILAQYQDALTIDDIDQLSIEQTQEVNARPHTVYVTDQVTNLRGSRWRTNNCPNGHAYKFRAVTDAVLADLSARNSRAVLAIEESSRVYVSGCIGTDIGTATFRPESANVTSSNDVHIDNIKLRIASGYDSGGGVDLRPAALVIGDSAFLPVTNSTFVGIDSACRGADQSFAVFIPTPVSGVHSEIVIDDITTRGGGLWTGGSTVPVMLRAFAVDGLSVSGLQHLGLDTPTALLESTVVNSTLAYESRRADPTVTNTGTGNKVIVDSEERAVFTPVIVGTTAAGSGTYTAQVGRYSKVGRRVHFQLHVVWTGHTGTGNLRISGLPFTSGAVANSFASVNIGQTSDVAMTAGNYMTGIVNTNSTQVILYQTPTGGGASGFVPMDAAGTLTIAGHYEAAS